MAGYSGTPLPQKLGIKPGAKLAIIDPPTGFSLDLPEGVALVEGRGRNLDVIVWFVLGRAALDKRFDQTAARLQPAGALWVAWPKKASGIRTDMTEDVVREIALPKGLVDNKVCAIDETWSGLRLVVRLENRAKKPRARLAP